MKSLKMSVSSLALLLSVSVVLLGCDGDKGTGGGGGGGGGNNTGVNNIKGGGGPLSCGTRECRTVTIGEQTWMAENLNITPNSGSCWCYNNSADSCSKYGTLYDWETAKKACPSGWHLPSREEWGVLGAFAGGTESYGSGGVAGTKLKATSGWYRDRNPNRMNDGTDDYGFSALPSGNAYKYSSSGNPLFSYVGYRGAWWTATIAVTAAQSAAKMNQPYYRETLTPYEGLGESTGDNEYSGLAVRCLKD
jgi:uncharacterized protein (TIGR02145 family)